MVAMNNDDELLTADEAAAKYKIHPKTFREWSDEGRVPKPVKWASDRDKRWRKSDIVGHIQSLEQMA